MLEPQAVWAIMPNHGEVPKRSLIEEVLRHVAGLTIVDDGSEEAVARALVESLAQTLGAVFVRLPERQGKGAALRAGLDAVRDQAPDAEAVLMIDADGQHPARAIPAFVIAGLDGGARDRRPLRRLGFDALAAPAGEPSQPASARAEHRPPGSGHAVWYATPARPCARAAAPGRRLRGGDPSPQGRARGRPRRRLGPYPGDLRRREELVRRTSRFRDASSQHSCSPAERPNTVAQPTATPNRLPTSTSDQ